MTTKQEKPNKDWIKNFDRKFVTICSDGAILKDIPPTEVKLFIAQALAEQSEKETIVCAAVMADDGSVYRGHRHGHCFQALRDEGKKEMPTADSQGFITTRNRFVNRKEARILQELAGIQSVDKNGYRANTLFSEDLYQHHKDGIITSITKKTL